MSFCSKVTPSVTFLLLFLIRCDGAARAVAPCVWRPGPTLPHAASCCVLPIPVSTATGAVCSPAAPTAPASASTSAPEPPVTATTTPVSKPAAAAAQSCAWRHGHATSHHSQFTGDYIVTICKKHFSVKNLINRDRFIYIYKREISNRVSEFLKFNLNYHMTI